MYLVAGFSENLQPKVWDPLSPYFISELHAIMLSYANFHGHPIRRRKAMDQGLHKYLGAQRCTKIYLDNGSFYFSKHGIETQMMEYEEFVIAARPDWCPIPRDFIPTPKMTKEEQEICFARTMKMNIDHQENGYVPVIHISRCLEMYVDAIQASEGLAKKPAIALGGIVPNLLRAPRAMPYNKILADLRRVREAFPEKKIHVFGVGGIATLHLAALLGMNSADSTGWRNRAARGIVQLPGSGDRIVAELGKWQIPQPSSDEWLRLGECQCPACKRYGLEGLKMNGNKGFCNRATHNLWTLLNESELINEHLKDGTYSVWYKKHLYNSIFRPLIDKTVEIYKI